jgi:hypothetical protein
MNRRLRIAVQFQNKLILFAEIQSTRRYAFSVSGSDSSGRFSMICNVLHPRTIDESFDHDGLGAVPGIKDDQEKWSLRGHRSRIVTVDNEVLGVFARLYDDPCTPALEARLPVVHSCELMDVLRQFSGGHERLGDTWDQVFCVYDHLNETRQQRDGTIRRETRYPRGIGDWVVSGPHFYVGNPLNKNPREKCGTHHDYDPVDLTMIPDDYLARTNYVPACGAKEYLARTPRWKGRLVTEFYRHVHRRMLAPTGERTMISCVMPPGITHMNTVLSTMMEDVAGTVLLAGVSASLPVDFFVKTTGKSDAFGDLLAQFPMPSEERLARPLRSRALRLNCLTTHYADLWSKLFVAEMKRDGFAKKDVRLASWMHLTKSWKRDSALRTPFDRRQALVELDALVAIALGLTLEQLLLTYSLQFPVLRQNERDTWYDQRGKIVFTVNGVIPGVGLERRQFDEIRDAKPGQRLPGWAKDAQGPFVPPFDRCDREVDMAQAYEHFQRILGVS